MRPVPVDVSPERFDELVDGALDQIPDELARLVRNVVVLVEEEPPAGEPADLLGLYDGVALTERDSQLTMNLPDRIFLFRRPLLEMCEDEEDLAEEIRITVVHEVAHHFGIDEEKLHSLGWG
jgi:predicted Zn-dependent protease with MMP-like domain